MPGNDGTDSGGGESKDDPEPEFADEHTIASLSTDGIMNPMRGVPTEPRDAGRGEPESPIKDEHSGTVAGFNSEAVAAVQVELERILGSRYFKTAGRSRQFLEFVVKHRLAGHPEQLKERAIGMEVFQRPANYATGDDPVVRVQAKEVRRRLEQFYQDHTLDSTIRIDLPVGSYSPEFHVQSVHAPTAQAVPETPINLESTSTISWRRLVGGGVLVLVTCGVLALLIVQRPLNVRSTIQEFWAPVIKTSQPALICLAKGVTYRPSPSLYARYRVAHPDTFQTEVEKSGDPLPLDPNETLQWRDLSLFTDYGVATGDVYAGIRISSTLGSLGKFAQLRIGSDYSFQDLRSSPSVIVGAFNNRWTMNLISSLRFQFVEQNGTFIIHEQLPNGRTWPLPGDVHAMGSNQRGSSAQTLDYAIVARLMDSNTGQFTVLAAGLTGAGTAAAGEFISSPDLLERAFHDAPANWKKSNSEFVLKTKVTDGVAGPPSVVASYYW